MDRIVIFTNSTDWGEHILVHSTLKALGSRNDMRLVGICLPRGANYRRIAYKYWLDKITRLVKRVVSPSAKTKPEVPRPINFELVAKQQNIKILIPPKENINDPSFIEQLDKELQPTIVLSFFCLQKFGANLLSIFDYAVNYHNALLPSYKGLKATAWSVYHGEPETGYTFHKMDEQLDEGNILLQEAIPVGENDNTADLDLQKVNRAADKLPTLLQLARDRSKGWAQRGEGNYFSRKAYREIVRISDPDSISRDELFRRLRAFLCLEIYIGGHWHSVTRVKSLASNDGFRGAYCFRTSDGFVLKATHFDFLPHSLYRMRKVVRRIF